MKLTYAIEIDGLPDDPTAWQESGLLGDLQAAGDGISRALTEVFPEQMAAGQVCSGVTSGWPVSTLQPYVAPTPAPDPA